MTHLSNLTKDDAVFSFTSNAKIVPDNPGVTKSAPLPLPVSLTLLGSTAVERCSPLISNRDIIYKMGREKDVSTRLIRPTIPEFDTARLLLFVERWDPNWEHDASIKIFDEGIAQYMLADIESHYKYMAALILSKPSLRCRLVDQEPDDVLDAEGNIITL
ncbi:hypothetical protein TELCIR_14387, partial [Teladorsagia circumcincta]